WTPEAHSEDELNSALQHYVVSSSNGSGGLFLSPAAPASSLSVPPVDSRVRKFSMLIGNASLPTPDVTQVRRLATVASGSGTRLLRHAATNVPARDCIDRSSVTMTAGSSATKSAHGMGASFHDDNGSYQSSDHDNTY